MSVWGSVSGRFMRDLVGVIDYLGKVPNSRVHDPLNISILLEDYRELKFFRVILEERHRKL